MEIVFDIGGTWMRVAASRDRTIWENMVTVRTPLVFRDGVHQLVELAKQLAHGRKIRTIVGGLPGTFDAAHRTLVRAPNLQKWEGEALASTLQRRLHARVILRNDTELAGLGEAMCGAGQGNRIVTYVTASTGIGGARIVDQQIDASAYGFEPGHQVIVVNGKPVDLNETYSGGALQRRFGIPAEEIHDRAVWGEVERMLGYALYNLSVIWSPDVLVVGGSLMKTASLANIRRHYTKLHHMFRRVPPLKKAQLDDQAGLFGALALLRGTVK